MTTAAKNAPIKGPIVVVGATGNVGRRVTDLVSGRRARVRAVSRHMPERSAPRGGVELVRADLRQPEQARRAVAGARIVYLTPPLSGQDPLENERAVASNVIKAARENNVDHVVIHTVLRANQGDTGVRIIDEKNDIESELKGSGVPYTILRPGWFFQNLAAEKDLLQRGVVALPLPGGRRLGGVSTEDVAKAAVAFIEKGPQGRGFDLHVPDGVDGPGIATALSAGMKQPVRFQEMSVEEFAAQASFNERQRELQAELFQYLHEHDFLGRSEEIKAALPEFRYTSLESFVKKELGPAVRASGTAALEPTPPVPPFPHPYGPRPEGGVGPGSGPQPPEPGPHLGSRHDTAR